MNSQSSASNVLGLLQDRGIEALCEPAVDRREEIARHIALALLAPELGKSDGGAQVSEPRALPLRNADSLAKAAFGAGGVVTGAQQLPPDPIQLGLGPPILSLGHQALGLGEMA